MLGLARSYGETTKDQCLVFPSLGAHAPGGSAPPPAANQVSIAWAKQSVKELASRLVSTVKAG